MALKEWEERDLETTDLPTSLPIVCPRHEVKYESTLDTVIVRGVPRIFLMTYVNETPYL